MNGIRKLLKVMEKKFRALNTKLLKEIVLTIIATVFIGFGVSIFIECRLGSDTLTVLLDGLSSAFGIPVSIVDQILSTVVLILAILMNRKKIGISSFINILFVGLSIVISEKVISPIKLYEYSFIIRFIFVWIAQIFFCASYALMQTFDSGMSTFDAVIYWIKERFNLKYITVRIMFDLFYVVVGVMLGGRIGIGTIVALITTGVITSFFYDLYTRKFMVKNNVKS